MNEDIKKKFVERLNQPDDPPFEATRDFLLSYVADKDSMEEVEADIRRMSQINNRTLMKGLKGIEELLEQSPYEEGALSQLVAWEVGWVLQDESDEGVRVWLGELADIIKNIYNDIYQYQASYDYKILN